MTELHQAQDGADAVRRFAAALRDRQPNRIQARLNGQDGMARLCAVEAAIADLWPVAIAKELVWLARSGVAEQDVLHLQALAADGEVLGAAAFRLAPARVQP